jgi:hypothetical protein
MIFFFFFWKTRRILPGQGTQRRSSSIDQAALEVHTQPLAGKVDIRGTCLQAHKPTKKLIFEAFFFSAKQVNIIFFLAFSFMMKIRNTKSYGLL